MIQQSGVSPVNFVLLDIKMIINCVLYKLNIFNQLRGFSLVCVRVCDMLACECLCLDCVGVHAHVVKARDAGG